MRPESSEWSHARGDAICGRACSGAGPTDLASLRLLLVGVKHAPELKGRRVSWLALVGDLQFAAGLADQLAHLVKKAPGHDQVAGESLVVAAQEPGISQVEARRRWRS